MASDRFNYDYPEHELEQLIPSIRELERRAELVQVIFNNNYQDRGQRNAATLMRLFVAADAFLTQVPTLG